MAKKTQKATTVTPCFDPHVVISEASLVVDSHGVAWWVDPYKKTVSRV